MPCWTVVQVEVKDRIMAEKALKQLGWEADFVQNANKSWTVTPKKTYADFRDKILTEYGIQVATARAKSEGFYVSRTEVNGESELTLRQY